MIKIKSKREVELIDHAGSIVAQCLKMLETSIKVGMNTKEIDTMVEDFIISKDATPSFKGLYNFPGSACISVNAEVVHGIPKTSQVLKAGDIITVDCGAKYKGYHADGAWTFVVGNSTDANTQKLLDVTQKALYLGIEQVKPNAYVSDISRAIENYVSQFGFGIIEELAGHGIGVDVHESPLVPNYVDNPRSKGPKLKEGMVLCIEPMITAGSKEVFEADDHWTYLTKDLSNSAHFEHTIAVTKDGCKILTK